jgi:16S rRNA (adenine1518-N6/adenine1519-N6)-dimethyltransferase
VVKVAFGQRRKMLRGSLKGLLSEEQISSCGIAPDRRPETLSLEEFVKLANLL